MEDNNQNNDEFDNENGNENGNGNINHTLNENINIKKNENKKSNISNVKFLIVITSFLIFYFYLESRPPRISKSLRKNIIKSFFIYIIKMLLTKYLLDEDKKESVFSKRNIINILISVVTLTLFLIFDETDFLI